MPIPQSFVAALGEERERQRDIEDTVRRNAAGKQEVKALQDQLRAVKQSIDSDMLATAERIAELKDALQECKHRTALERKLVRKEATNTVDMAKKRCTKELRDVTEQVDSRRSRIEDEKGIHEEVIQFLKSNYTSLTQQLEGWMRRHEQHTEEKQQELEALKGNRARDLGKLQELTETYQEYETIVRQDQQNKAKAKAGALQVVPTAAMSLVSVSPELYFSMFRGARWIVGWTV